MVVSAFCIEHIGNADWRWAAVEVSRMFLGSGVTLNISGFVLIVCLLAEGIELRFEVDISRIRMGKLTIRPTLAYPGHEILNAEWFSVIGRWFVIIALVVEALAEASSRL